MTFISAKDLPDPLGSYAGGLLVDPNDFSIEAEQRRTASCVRHGVTRTVLLSRHYAFKFPILKYGYRQFVAGVLANLTERQYASLGDARLCPMVWASCTGLLNVMRRAEPIPQDRYEALPESFMDGLPHGDRKPPNFGIYCGRVVMVDYA